MEIRERDKGNITILEPVGRLDGKSVQELEGKIVELLQKKKNYFVVDMGALEHIGAAGLRVLLTLLTRLEASGGRVILCSLNDQIKEALDVAGFTDVFFIAPSQQEAIKRLEPLLPEHRRSWAIARLAANLLGIKTTAGEDFAAGGESRSARSRKIAELAADLLIPERQSSSTAEKASGAVEAASSETPPTDSERSEPRPAPIREAISNARRKIGGWFD